MSEDHDILIELKSDIKYIKKSVEDYDTRVSKLERWQAYIIGLSAVVAFVVSEILSHNWLAR